MRALTPAGFRRISDLMAEDVPPFSWLAEPIFTSDALGVIGAAPKSFKSWMLLDLVVATSTGMPWLGTFRLRGVGPVVFVSPEGGERGLVRRLSAILSANGGEPGDLSISFVRTRGLTLTDARDVGDLRSVCAEVRPVMIAYDSLYTGLEGVGTSQLSESGMALRTLSETAAVHDAAVVTTHHLNARDGSGLHRLTGAGVAEWASAILLGTLGSRTTVAGLTAAAVHWSLTGRDVPSLNFATRFSIGTDDPTDVASPLRYSVSVRLETEAESELGWTERRVLDALSIAGPGGAHVRAIGDLLAREGPPLRAGTIHEALTRLLDLDLADGADDTWWATSDRGAPR